MNVDVELDPPREKYLRFSSELLKEYQMLHIGQICKRGLNFFLPPTHLVVNTEKLGEQLLKENCRSFSINLPKNCQLHPTYGY